MAAKKRVLNWGLCLVFTFYFQQVNGITISLGSEAECKDSIDNCQEYGIETCGGLYLSWAKSNCPATCGICTPSLTTETPACVDLLDNCHTYQDDICTNLAYRGWAQGNCRKFCRFCTESQLNLLDSQTTLLANTKSPADCYDKFKCESFGTIACSTEKYGNWGQLNCPVYCGFCQGTTPTTTTVADCIDARLDCATFQEDTCTNPLYKNWAESNCRKFCKFCDPATTTMPSSTLITTTPSSTSAPCVDVKPDCATFHEDTCTNPSLQTWAETNCRKFCKLCGTNLTMMVTTMKAPPLVTTMKALIVTSTKSPPPVTTTKVPPVITTKAPPPVTTTKVSHVTTTKAPPHITTTRAYPPIITTKVLPIFTTKSLSTITNHTTMVHLPPTFKTPPPLIKTPPPLVGK